MGRGARFVHVLRSRLRLASTQLLAIVLALMICVTLTLAWCAFPVAEQRTMIWLLIGTQFLIAGVGAWMLLRETQRAQALDQQAARKSEKLRERLSIATQAAGIYCWELDWSTYTITWDASRLPHDEVAAASRRHFGAELGSDLFKYVHPE